MISYHIGATYGRWKPVWSRSQESYQRCVMKKKKKCIVKMSWMGLPCPPPTTTPQNRYGIYYSVDRTKTVGNKCGRVRRAILHYYANVIRIRDVCSVSFMYRKVRTCIKRREVLCASRTLCNDDRRSHRRRRRRSRRRRLRRGSSGTLAHLASVECGVFTRGVPRHR